MNKKININSTTLPDLPHGTSVLHLPQFLLPLVICSLMTSTNVLKAQIFNLNTEFSQVEQRIAVMDKVNSEVSEAPVRWHLLHALQVINAIYEKAETSDQYDFSSTSNIKWLYVSTLGKIPRGKVKAPDSVNPAFEISREEILAALTRARASISKVTLLEKDQFYDHAILLHLNKRKIKRFLKVHTRHHLKIVDDIVKHSNKAR